MTEARIVPTLLGLRQAFKITIYDYLPKFYHITFELFLYLGGGGYQMMTIDDEGWGGFGQ